MMVETAVEEGLDMEKKPENIFVRTLKRIGWRNYALLGGLVFLALLMTTPITWRPKDSLPMLILIAVFFSIVFFDSFMEELDHTDKRYTDDCLEIIRGSKIEQRIPYEDIGVILLAKHYVGGKLKYAIDFRGNRYQAVAAVYHRSSKILRRMNLYTSVGTHRMYRNDEIDSFIFNPHALREIMDKTGCGLYITKDIFDSYEDELSSITRFYSHRILICCGTEKQPLFYTYSDYKMLPPERTLLAKFRSNFRS